MARPTKQNVDYFSHDCDMRNDIKIKALEAKLSINERAEDSLVKLAYNAQKKADKSAKAVRDLIKKGVCDTAEVLIALNDCDSVNDSPASPPPTPSRWPTTNASAAASR